MKSNVSGIMKQLVPAFLIAYPTASSRITRDARGLERAEDLVEVPPALRMIDIDIDLLGVKVVQSSRRAAVLRCRWTVNGSPGRGR